MLDDLIADGKELLAKVRRHYVEDADTLRADQQVPDAEVKAWYRGVENALGRHFGETSYELRTWKERIQESTNAVSDAMSRGDKPSGGQWVVHLLAESIGSLTEIKLTTPRRRR